MVPGIRNWETHGLHFLLKSLLLFHVLFSSQIYRQNVTFTYGLKQLVCWSSVGQGCRKKNQHCSTVKTTSDQKLFVKTTSIKIFQHLANGFLFPLPHHQLKQAQYVAAKRRSSALTSQTLYLGFSWHPDGKSTAFMLTLEAWNNLVSLRPCIAGWSSPNWQLLAMLGWRMQPTSFP